MGIQYVGLEQQGFGSPADARAGIIAAVGAYNMFKKGGTEDERRKRLAMDETEASDRLLTNKFHRDQAGKASRRADEKYEWDKADRAEAQSLKNAPGYFSTEYAHGNLGEAPEPFGVQEPDAIPSQAPSLNPAALMPQPQAPNWQPPITQASSPSPAPSSPSNANQPGLMERLYPTTAQWSNDGKHSRAERAFAAVGETAENLGTALFADGRLAKEVKENIVSPALEWAFGAPDSSPVPAKEAVEAISTVLQDPKKMAGFQKVGEAVKFLPEKAQSALGEHAAESFQPSTPPNMAIDPSQAQMPKPLPTASTMAKDQKNVTFAKKGQMPEYAQLPQWYKDNLRNKYGLSDIQSQQLWDATRAANTGGEEAIKSSKIPGTDKVMVTGSDGKTQIVDASEDTQLSEAELSGVLNDPRQFAKLTTGQQARAKAFLSFTKDVAEAGASQNKKFSEGDKSLVVNLEEMNKALDEFEQTVNQYGNFENEWLGNKKASANLAALPYRIAIMYAKIVDPASVAREGEVNAAQKYMIKTGMFTPNGITTAGIKNMREEINHRAKVYSQEFGVGTKASQGLAPQGEPDQQKFQSEDEARQSGAEPGDMVTVFDPQSGRYRQGRLK